MSDVTLHVNITPLTV